jgi:ATP-dependent RNA helicase RhlE
MAFDRTRRRSNRPGARRGGITPRPETAATRPMPTPVPAPAPARAATPAEPRRTPAPPRAPRRDTAPARPIAPPERIAAPTVDTSFEALGVSAARRRAVERAGYTTPTPIQRAAIPAVREGRDLLGCAQTGTGKTAAFALPILDRLAARPITRRAREIRTLVLAPTRELAAQIAESFTRYGAGSDIRAIAVFGGVGKGNQVRDLRRGVDVLVACPGRLLDLIQERAVSLASVEVLVLDEADRMLDMGFVRDVRRIVAMTPRTRQTLLFSATMPQEIRSLASEMLRDPVSIAVDPISSPGEPISQSVYFVDKGDKVDLLVTLLGTPEIRRTLVFTRTKHGADRVVRRLGRVGVPAVAIHGNKTQGARERALSGIKNGHTRVVVATDIAARGIDIHDLSHVINYDLPMDPESYVHRIGRTGRAGASGIALSFCSPEEAPRLSAIEKLTARRIARAATPDVDRTAASRSRSAVPAGSGARNAESRTQRARRGGSGRRRRR